MELKKLSTWLKNNALLIGTILGVISGIGIGFSLRELKLAEEWNQVISYPGEIFTRALEMMILPLIISSLVVGSASINAKANGKIALRTMSYFIVTSVFNAALGVVLVIIIRPGDQDIDFENEHVLEERQNTLLDNFLDLGRNIVPNNIFRALFQQTQTVYEKSLNENGTEIYSRNVVMRDGPNTLGIITFALLFGTILGSMEGHAKSLVESFRVADNVIMSIVRGVMCFDEHVVVYPGRVTPFGVASIITSKILSVEDVGAITRQLGLFVLTVLAGVLIYQLIVLQLIYLVVKRKNPWPFHMGMMPATVTAVATASTAVALPVSFRCMENMKVDSRIAQFVLPIGATVNKDGAALFVSVASIFIAQMNGISLGVGQLVTVVIASTAVSIASASVPSAALALMFIVLNSIGAPTKDIGLLFAVDWLVDRIRTVTNHLGDCYATVVVEYFSQNELKLMDLNHKEGDEKDTIFKVDSVENIDGTINSKLKFGDP